MAQQQQTFLTGLTGLTGLVDPSRLGHRVASQREETPSSEVILNRKRAYRTNKPAPKRLNAARGTFGLAFVVSQSS